MTVYKIKDLEILSGVKAHTIRMWEKRYGLLKPERTDTKIRMYSDKDLMVLLNVALLNKNGKKISHIVNMSDDQISQEVMAIDDKVSQDSLVDKMILALIQMDKKLFLANFHKIIAEEGLFEAFSGRLRSFLTRIGVMWQVGTIDPAQEHFVSNMMRNTLIAATENLEENPKPEKLFILFLPENEWHEISLLLYNYKLLKDGYATVYLGQSVPDQALINTIARFKVDALVTSFITAVDEDHILEFFTTLSKNHQLPIYTGAEMLDSLSKPLPASIHKVTDLFK
ncbi:DNA-binding transcriptional regulator, MerR family [Lishizhenia tianjinensis]|uniref:DNA-binding transcriptional regulator, MerR family n=1 Tax=Lishizhenia tianjinensis TaxID=477690 RepID=A0A1I7BW03_9FLAO|nr:MerR family transcriptional regulator [Lishizhenia tianjinensis]SFT91309.1 DNA-binding transcriptional regulator, MerR family [Lishizhenia tianjinensis]